MCLERYQDEIGESLREKGEGRQQLNRAHSIVSIASKPKRMRMCMDELGLEGEKCEGNQTVLTA